MQSFPVQKAIGPICLPRSGRASARGYILSGHYGCRSGQRAGMEPDPFVLRRDGERLYGRGTSDMKGFLACALAALPRLRR